MKRALVCLLFVWSMGGCARKAKETAGIVELVMGSGDLRPARFAMVVVLPADKTETVELMRSIQSDADEYARAKAGKTSAVKSIPDQQKLAANVEFQAGVEKICAGELTSLGALMREVPGAMVTTADENGEFQLKGLLNQAYTVFAVGRAGQNAGLWVRGLALSEQPDRLKLVKPSIACYDPGGIFQ